MVEIKLNNDKVSTAIKVEMPYGKTGYVEPRERFNKLVVYKQGEKVLWAHKAYLAN